MPVALGFGQGEFVPALGAFCALAVHRRFAARASKGSTIGYVKRKTAFGTADYSLWISAHCDPFPCEPINKILKAFLDMFKRVDAELNS